LIECISMDGKLLLPWVIFKGKKQNLAWMEMLEKGHIALSENRWTDNQLCLEWLKKCFELETRRGTNRYHLLIMDSHRSYITIAALRFCLASKIIVLCLPSHTTHLLQLLDVGPFRPLAIAYKIGIQEQGYLNPVYSVDKLEFLEVYKTARLRGISKANIEKGWRNAGLEPFDPRAVLELLPKPVSEALDSTLDTTFNPTLEFTLDSTPDFARITPDFASISPDFAQIPTTPANVKDMDLLFSRIFQGSISLDLGTLD
jgi:DDE superfamily endonuclease